MAFLAGLGVATGKQVLLLQEGWHRQPIDYRDIVKPFTSTDGIVPLMTNFIKSTAETVIDYDEAPMPQIDGVLAKLDLGDVAAENEIMSLPRYFVRTPQFQDTIQGHARLVVGRKGSGKTAIFYGARKSIRSHSTLVLDLKPEGHQFARLREMVLKHLSEGMQSHTLTAFWTYILLTELARKILEDNAQTGRAFRTGEDVDRHESLIGICSGSTEGSAKDLFEKDFSERLLDAVERIISSFSDQEGNLKASRLTNIIYSGDIGKLLGEVSQALSRWDEVWILLDNLDKGWPTLSAHDEDIMILRSLLEASRKIQRALEKRGVEFKSVIFIRKDVHDLLVAKTSDRGKESVANLDWSDTTMMKALLGHRFSAAGIDGAFDEVWPRLFDPNIGAEDSFQYILDRTLNRPRDLLNFVRKCIQIAVSRGHTVVKSEDVSTAEDSYSEDMFRDVKYEIADVCPQYPDMINAFLGESGPMSRRQIVELLETLAEVPEGECDKVIRLLLWFSFLGVRTPSSDVRYSYQVYYNVDKIDALVLGVGEASECYHVHPAFLNALRY